MSDNRLLTLGVDALARAHGFDYFVDGHRGAGIVAAHFLCVDNKLDERACERIRELVDLNWSSTALCAPLPLEEPEPNRIEEIGRALMEGASELRQVGHNAIFAMLAVKAFRALPPAATPMRIDGVCRTIRAMTPWRDVAPDDDVQPPPFSDGAAASRFILRETLDAIDRFVGFGQGYAGHMLTFGQALVELASMGYVTWADSCRDAFRKYVTVTRLGPEPTAGDGKTIRRRNGARSRPGTGRNVGSRRWDWHVFKYPYSCYDLLRRAGDPELAAEWDRKAYHVF